MPRRGMKPDLNGYRERWKVERTFAWLFNFRRLIVRWEHDYHIFLAFLIIACIIILLGQFRDDF
ncbi:transposase [Dehalococcoidia bacterium]|nr:transposase [Dehalococcoidia bacterium]